MNESRRGDYIQTASHRKFWPLDPRPEDVDINDIAHALSNLCRFTGHSSEFYSVSQHSVIASQLVPRASALAALLHDSAEAYMGDIARPWKRFLYVRTGGLDAIYDSLKDTEHALLDVILVALKCPPRTETDIWNPVHEADERMLVTEARDFMAPLVDGSRNTFMGTGRKPLDYTLSAWSPKYAKMIFLERYAELTSSPLTDS